MTIVRMYLQSPDFKRPTHYREAWWEEETKEFVLHYGKVGEIGTTKVESVSKPNEAETLLSSFLEQCQNDSYVDVDQIVQENCTVTIKQKGQDPTSVEFTNAEKFLQEYTALLAWRGIGAVQDWQAVPGQGKFVFEVRSVHRNKAMKLASQAIQKTDIRADRLSMEGR